MAERNHKPEVSPIKIPILSVLKNGLILKNIILNITPPQPNSATDQILIGRHPDCHIVLDHPSISRFHLDLQANTQLQQLIVTDHSSVHGTWVSGNKIQPNVPVGLAEGDTLRLGASTREYRLHWVPMTSVDEMERPLSTLLEDDEETHQENLNESRVQQIPSAPPMPVSMDPLNADGLFSFPLKREDWSSDIKELQDESLSVSSVVPLHESAGSKISLANEAPWEHLSPMRSEKKVNSSSLLSRRSKSISFLRIHGGSNKESTPNTAIGDDKGEEPPLCRVLFDEGNEEETFDSDKENAIPVVSNPPEVDSGKGRVELESSHRSTAISNQDTPNPGSSVKNEREEVFASPYKENLTPNSSSSRKLKKSFLRLERPVLNGGEEEVFLSDKENRTPEGIRNQELKKPIFESHEKIAKKEEDGFASPYKVNLTPNTSSGRKLKKSFLGLQRVLNGGEEEVFLSDKENRTPGVLRDLELKKSISECPGKIVKDEQDAFALDKENLTPKVSGSLRTKNSSKSIDRIEREIIRKRVERVPFQSLLENSPSRNKSTLVDAHNSPANQADCCSPSQSISENSVNNKREEDAAAKVYGAQKSKYPMANCDRIERGSLLENPCFRNSNSLDNYFSQHKGQVTHRGEEKNNRWNFVADASCFLDDESRRSLELLEGLKGTHLIIPRIVIRELDCLKRREGLFRKTTKASTVLQWIETCMVRTSWWIHVQSSLEMMPIAPTPPASPRLPISEGIGELGSGPLNSRVFSTCGSLMEIVSPTAEDHILDCALLFKKLKNDARFVLLTNSVTLKIKAMAEGLLCETPMEFRDSLVNPYSKRFLWVSSSPRGSTWSCSDEQLEETENYYHHQRPAGRRTVKPAEGAKGLKLILMHNCHYGKINMVN